MFYCDECARITGWPDMPVKSRGGCEMCGAYAVCTDWPSRGLSTPTSTMFAQIQLRRDDVLRQKEAARLERQKEKEMPRFRWEWRGGTHVDTADALGRPNKEHRLRSKEIQIIDGRDGTQYAITNDVQKAERIVSCLNYGEHLARTV